MEGAFLDWALEQCSGYVAVAELSEGPYGVRAVVDTRHDTRMRSEVLDRQPTPADSEACLTRWQRA